MLGESKNTVQRLMCIKAVSVPKSTVSFRTCVQTKTSIADVPHKLNRHNKSLMCKTRLLGSSEVNHRASFTEVLKQESASPL